MRTRAAGWGVLAAALLLSACAAEKAVLAPTPPVEIRKEASPPPAPAKAAAMPPSAPAAAVLPDYPRMYREAFVRTKEAFQQGRVRDAIPYWKALEASPWGTDAVFHQGVILHLAGDLDGAAESYGRLTDRAPVFEPAAANLLGIRLLRGNLKEARPLIERILPAGSGPHAEMLNELQANLGAALVELGDLAGAERLFKGIAGDMRPPSLSWNMAVLAYRRGDPANARRLSSEVPAEVGKLWPVIASRFAWERESGRIPPAADVPAAERRISALAWNLAAYDEYRKGNLKGAEDILAKEKANAAPFGAISGNLGLLQMEQGKLKEARRNLEKAVEEEPELREGWLNLGIFREVYEGNTAGALECYGRYVRMNGSRKEEVGQWIERLQKSSPQP